MKQLSRLLKILFLSIMIIKVNMAFGAISFTAKYPIALGGIKFTSIYRCSESVKTCVSTGKRIIDGLEADRNCWEWAYIRTCDYPSKDTCRNYPHCFFVKNHACILKDLLGNCVNLHREFSCESWEPVTIENKTIRTGLKEIDGPEGLVCKGVPCIDGNCVDKSYQTNGEMMDSITKLYAVSKMKPDGDMNFRLFQGTHQYCAKKATSYSNCCRRDPAGWGKHMGAKCTKDENNLADRRSKKLCVYVDKTQKKTLGVTDIVKHHFCCFSSLLDKIIQVQGRGQLGMNFGTGHSPNCRGLTIDEIQRIDFSRLDFSEFIDDFKMKFAGKYKAPQAGELAQTVQNSTNNVRKYDDNPHNQQNNMTGWNGGEKFDE